MKKKIKFVLTAFISITLITGCDKNKEFPSGTDYSQGIYIVNEGGYGSNNGSISYLDLSSSVITNGIFEAANHRSPGDVVQSFSVVADTSGYIVVNGSGKVEIVRLKDFKTISEPIPVTYPRYFLQVGSNKGYLTGGTLQGWIYVFDLSAHEIQDSVMVGYGPETMIQSGDQVFVANSGGWSVDSTISVLDPVSDQVTARINVGKVPLDMALDAENYLWVYCKGYATYNNQPPYELLSETDALLQKIDLAGRHIIWSQSIGKAGDYTATPPKMAISKSRDRIYYLRPEGVFEISTSNPVISQSVMIPGSFYGIEVNPSDDNLYLFEASFTGNGTLKIYNTSGQLMQQGTVGIAPNSAVFKPEQ